MKKYETQPLVLDVGPQVRAGGWLSLAALGNQGSSWERSGVRGSRGACGLLGGDKPSLFFHKLANDLPD